MGVPAALLAAPDLCEFLRYPLELLGLRFRDGGLAGWQR
jgi:hypothetical protein